MRRSRWGSPPNPRPGRALLGLLPLAGGAALAACTFPDVGYADADAGASETSSSSGATSSGGTACAQLAACTSTAATCTTNAVTADEACVQVCNGKPPCVSKCDGTLADARASCAMTCDGCAPGCATAVSECRTAAGL